VIWQVATRGEDGKGERRTSIVSRQEKSSLAQRMTRKEKERKRRKRNGEDKKE